MQTTSNEFPVLSASLVALAHPDLEDSVLGHEIGRMWELCQRGVDEPIACVLGIRMLGREHVRGDLAPMAVIPVPCSLAGPARPLTYSCIDDAMAEWDPFESRSDVQRLEDTAREIAEIGVTDLEIVETPALSWHE